MKVLSLLVALTGLIVVFGKRAFSRLAVALSLSCVSGPTTCVVCVCCKATAQPMCSSLSRLSAVLNQPNANRPVFAPNRRSVPARGEAEWEWEWVEFVAADGAEESVVGTDLEAAGAEAITAVCTDVRMEPLG
jgi:hypothetical protein